MKTPTSPSIKARLLQWLADQLPTVRKTLFNVRQMQVETAPDLDVDRVHAIITEAQTGNIDELLRLYRDMVMSGSHLQGRFVERKEAVLGDTLALKPIDDKNPDDVAAAAVVQAMIDDCKDWETAMAHLLDSVLWPVAIVEKTFKVSDATVNVKGRAPVRLQYELASLTVVPYELLTHINGRLQIRDTDEFGNPLGTYRDPDPGRYLIHRGHLLTSVPDNWGGPMRSIVFWWLLGHMGRDWWARFLDKYGAPFVVAKYDQGDDATRSILTQALSYATKVGGLVVSRETDIAIQQTNSSGGGDAYDKFRVACNEEISNLVLGQSLSSHAKSTGLGSGVSRQQEQMRQDKRMADARRLGATLRYQLADQYLQINGLPGRPPKFLWGADTPDESTATGQMLVALSQAGLQPTADALPTISEKMGFPIERAAPPPAPVMPPGSDGPPGMALHSVHRVQAATRLDTANAAIVRAAAAQLAPVMRKRHAPIVQLIRTAHSPADAMGRVEAYCARLDPLEAADITESALKAMAANGAAAHAE